MGAAPDINAMLRDFAARGMRVADAARACGISSKAILARTRRLGIVLSAGGDRQDDERILQMLRLRQRMTSADVGRVMGMTPERVRVLSQRVLSQRVLADDLAQSGEPEAVVRRHYPWAKSR